MQNTGRIRVDETLFSAGRVVAVVVTFNRCAQLQHSLRCLLAAPEHQLSGIVVVDNASSDGTEAWLSNLEDSRLSVLRLPQNVGGAGGFAAGLSKAVERFNADWVLLMDDDAYPTRNALQAFHASARPRNRAFCAAVYDPSGRVSVINRPFWNPFRSPWRFVMTLLRGKSAYYASDRQFDCSNSLPVDFATFVGFFVSAEALQRVAPPDRRFFIYCDDLDFCARLTRSGIDIHFDPSIRFYHDCKTFDAGRRVYDPLWKSYYAHRNGLYFARCVAGRLKTPITLGLVLLWALRSVFYRRPHRYLGLLWWALKDACANDFSRSHADILRRAARGTGWQSTVKAIPHVEQSRQLSATKNES